MYIQNKGKKAVFTLITNDSVLSAQKVFNNVQMLVYQ